MDKSQRDLNDRYRNGGDPKETMENGRDCVWHCRLIRSVPAMLYNELLEMGYFDDDQLMPWERTE